MDTPGFSSLYLFDMEEDNVKDYFPEFRKYEDQCRFLGCRHISEPDCAVKEALEKGEVSKIRYENYLGVFKELKEKRRY
jgi:ribosome biogenesis GTPase